MLTRALIVLLLVLNLGVATWWLLRPAAPPPPAPSQPHGVPRLQLLSELPRRPRAAPAVAPLPEPAAEPAAEGTGELAEAGLGPARCFQIGPFADEAAANAARTALQPQAQRASVRAQQPPARAGGWNVAMPALADRAAAQAMVQRLVAAGFTDNYVVGDGDAANSIALGRFGSQESAQRQQAALATAGFQTQVQGPAAAAPSWWVDLNASPAFNPAGAGAALGTAQARPVDCATLG